MTALGCVAPQPLAASPSLYRVRCLFVASSPRRRIRELLAVAQSKLGYLRVITPRRADDDDALREGGLRRYVVADGHVVEVDAASGGGDGGRGGGAVKNWGPGNVDPDSLRRHEALMKRYRFEDRAGVPRGPFAR